MIDLIVPFVNGEDILWKRQYNYYSNSNRTQRFRDYGTLRFLFRSVELFCPFISRIFLVVQQDSQIPSWINVSCSKLKIVFHKDFIPKEFLPTFNSNVIEMFFNRIEELSEDFILANDDMVFLKPNNVDAWFIDGCPQYSIRVITENHKTPPPSKIFRNILYNDIRLANILSKSGKMIEYKNWHIPIAYKKSCWNKVWSLSKNHILNSLRNSKFRSVKNLSHWIFNYYQILTDITKHNPNYEQNGYICIKDNSTKEQIENKINNAKVACFNDGIDVRTDLFEVLHSKLESLLPNKSSFEL